MTSRDQYVWGAITDVPGIRVGQVERVGDGWLTGVSVVVPPPGTVGGVDVRGGGPGTHETDALDPTTLVPTVDAVVLTGGSAYGLVAAHGVQRRLEELGRGFGVGPPDDPGSLVVPIVPAAAVFDLARGGDASARPDAGMGYAAARLAADDPAGGATGGAIGRTIGEAAGEALHAVQRGCVGAGTGTVLAAGTLKGGVGTASVRLPMFGVTVGALVVVNAVGSALDPTTGRLLGAAFVPAGLPRPGTPTDEELAAWRAVQQQPGSAAGPAPGAATTLAVVATDAALDPARTRRMAAAAHAGLARTLDPVHTLMDGDTVFALATGAVPVETHDPREALFHVMTVHAAAATAVALAVMDAVLSATPTQVFTAAGTRGAPAQGVDVPSYAALFPSVTLAS